MRVLVIGTEGYIGARLALPVELRARGDRARYGFYRDGCLCMDSLGQPVGLRTVYKDLRAVTAEDLRGSTPSCAHSRGRAERSP